MALKLPIFESVPAINLSKLTVDISKILNKDSIERILKSFIEKISNHEVLSVDEVRIMIDWHLNLIVIDKINFSKYISSYIEVQPELMDLIIEYFRELKQRETIQFLLTISGIQQRIGEDNFKSFKFFTSKSNPMELSSYEKIEYIENLRIIESKAYTSGQKLIASTIIPESDFSGIFENKYDYLMSFIKKCGIEEVLPLAKYLDRQLGILLKQKESEVTAKAFRQELGYAKYVKFVESNFSMTQRSTLNHFNHLKRLIARFEEAVQILSGEEVVRGTFWKSNIEKLDGIMMKKSNSSKYKIGVAFFVSDFVFCDFGPSGNQIFIYDKEVFVKQVEPLGFWQNDLLLTDKLMPNKFPHQVHSWQEKALGLIKRARRYE